MRNVTKQKRKRRLTVSIDHKGMVQGPRNYGTTSKLISTLRRMTAIAYAQKHPD
jgi:hypothetical protein